MPSVTVDDQLAGRLRNGMQVNLPDFSQAPLIKIFTAPTELLAIGRRVAGTLYAADRRSRLACPARNSRILLPIIPTDSVR